MLTLINTDCRSLLTTLIVCVILVKVVDCQWHFSNNYHNSNAKGRQYERPQGFFSALLHGPPRKRQPEITPSPETVFTSPEHRSDFHDSPPPLSPFPSSSLVASPPRCGETFNCTSSGIFHKPFHPVWANERCVWTVVVPGATGYMVDVMYLGWDPADNRTGSKILINGFKRGSPPTEIVPSGKGPIIVPESTLMVVTFITGSNPRNSTGFILQYSTLTNGTVPTVTPLSRHQLIRPDTIYLRHPMSSSNYYQNNEMSSFVFQPENNVHVEGQRSKIVYMRIGLDGANCGDFLDVYGLNLTTTARGTDNCRDARWDFRGRICGNMDTQLITGDDMLLMVFQSDQGGTNYGFHLTYTTC